jgi:hypothetical protein
MNISAVQMNNKFSRIQLHPELQPYLDRDEGTIDHPIYRCEFAHQVFYHRINLVYESKKQKIDRLSIDGNNQKLSYQAEW